MDKKLNIYSDINTVGGSAANSSCDDNSHFGEVILNAEVF